MNLFNRLIDRFAGQNSPQGATQTGNEHNINASILEQFNRYNPLMTLQDNRQLLEVLIPNSKNSFQSMIITIDFIQQRLILDECLPTLSNPHTLVGKRIYHQTSNKTANAEHGLRSASLG